jgi:hypothetical protein
MEKSDGFCQGILKREVSLYLLFDSFGNYLFLFAKQTNQKPAKQEDNGTTILPPLVFPSLGLR